MRKFLSKIHLWLSIPAGLFILLMCGTGAILVFEEELTRWTHPARYRVAEVPESAERMPLDVLMAGVNACLLDTAVVTGVWVTPEPLRTYIASVSGKNKTRLAVDPYTGRITDVFQENPRQGFFAKVKELHRWLLMKGGSKSPGRKITGVATLILVFVLLTGLLIWFPRHVRQLKYRLKIRLHSGWRWFWYDLHVAGGFYTAGLLLVMALTALTWSFGWYREGFFKLFDAETPVRTAVEAGSDSDQFKGQADDPAPVQPETVEAESRSASSTEAGNAGAELGKKTVLKKINYAAWDHFLAELSETSDYTSVSIQNYSATVVPRKAVENRRASDRYTFDSRTGSIRKVVPYADQSRTNKLRGWLYSVHTGSWGGILTKTAWFLAALIGTLLPLTGYYLYLKRWRRKQKRNREILR